MNKREAELQRCLEKTLELLKTGRRITVLVEPMGFCVGGVMFDKTGVNVLIDMIEDTQRTLREDGKP